MMKLFKRWYLAIQNILRKVKKISAAKRTKDNPYALGRNKEKSAIIEEAMQQCLQTKYHEREVDHFSILPTRRFH